MCSKQQQKIDRQREREEKGFTSSSVAAAFAKLSSSHRRLQIAYGGRDPWLRPSHT